MSRIDQLSQLSEFTAIVADTGDFESIKKYRPVDATTNPSLLFAAAQQKQYAHLVDDAIKYGKNKASELGQAKRVLEFTMDKLSINFGTEITKIVPGVVSTEVDARLSFDTKAMVDKARQLIAMYEENGVGKDRILIKLATTWEGIKAAEILEKEGIHCNMTLLFSMVQAVAAAEVGATLISPFVGRIMDWHKDKKKVKGFAPREDPGVISVTNIYNYYKKHGHKTIVMGASFRNKGEIVQLAGCDKLTISPNLLEELKNSSEPIQRVLSPDNSQDLNIPKLRITESTFRYLLNDDACATEKLAEGIRKFAEDSQKLEKIIKERIRSNL